MSDRVFALRMTLRHVLRSIVDDFPICEQESLELQMDIKAALKPILESAKGREILDRIRSSGETRLALDELYNLFPRPVRWVIPKDKFVGYVMASLAPSKQN